MKIRLWQNDECACIFQPPEGVSCRHLLAGTLNFTNELSKINKTSKLWQFWLIYNTFLYAHNTRVLKMLKRTTPKNKKQIVAFKRLCLWTGAVNQYWLTAPVTWLQSSTESGAASLSPKDFNHGSCESVAGQSAAGQSAGCLDL